MIIRSQPLQASTHAHLASHHAACYCYRDGYKVLVVGGGAAGITTASHYARKLPNHQVAVIEVCAYVPN